MNVVELGFKIDRKRCVCVCSFIAPKCMLKSLVAIIVKVELIYCLLAV